MPCLIAILALLVPRFTIIVLALMSDYLSRAYTTFLWPLLGFFFMPYTTLAYALAMNENGSVTGVYLVVLIIAVLVDLGSMGGAEKTRRTRVRHG